MLSKVDVITEALAQEKAGVFLFNERHWLRKSSGREEATARAGSPCEGCAAGALLYGWLCKTDSTVHMDEIDVRLYFGAVAQGLDGLFTEEELLQLDAAYTGRLSEDDLDIRDILDGHQVELPLLRALCWGLHRWGGRTKCGSMEMLAQDDVRGRELLQHMLQHDGKLVIPELSGEQCLTFLSTEEWPLEEEKGGTAPA